MPETYDVIVAALLESNLTTATPIPSPTITAIGIRNTGRNTTRSGGSNNGRPRVSRYVRCNRSLIVLVKSNAACSSTLLKLGQPKKRQ